MLKYILVMILWFNFTIEAKIGDYLWPLPNDKVRELSSTFKENRVDHFHTGIDIRTNGRVGLPLVSVSDGYVYRVKISPFGYGKALYIKLNDGNYAVYAHLDDFNEKIRNRVLAKQLKNETYTTEIYFQKNEIPITKGDTVAFAGETGVGYPHLHFEIRDKNNLALNALKYYDVIDKHKPEIRSIKLLSTNGHINGEMQKFNIKSDVIKKGGSFWITKGDYYIAGEIFDYSDNNKTFKNAPYLIELSLKNTFKIKYIL